MALQRSRGLQIALILVAAAIAVSVVASIFRALFWLFLLAIAFLAGAYVARRRDRV